MRIYENLITQRLALFDLPAKYEQTQASKSKSYIEKIFRQLLVLDQSPDDNLGEVLEELRKANDYPDYGFEPLFRNDFETYIQSGMHLARWNKIKQDYNFYIERENKRRNKNNPYYNTEITKADSWEDIPNLSRGRHNQPWQFDALYTEAQYIAGEVAALARKYKDAKDKDLFRAKVNSLMAPAKLVYAFNVPDNLFDYPENEIQIINIKLSLDGQKSASVFLNKLVESLHKIRWSRPGSEAVVDSIISSAETLISRLRKRIADSERSFMLFMNSLSSDFLEQ